MLSNATTLSLLLAAMVCCAIGGPVMYEGKYWDDNSTMVFPEDLPTGIVDDKVMKVIKDVKNVLKYFDPADFDAAPGQYRGKRSANVNWCCKIAKTPTQRQAEPVIRSRIIHKTVTDTEQRSCGFFGFGKCSNRKVKTIPVVEYYTDVVYRDVPADEFRNGCPRDLIECCAGYLHYPPHFTNCLNSTELAAFLPLVYDAQALGPRLF